MIRKTTMDDIAKELNVSKSLVSKAIAGKYGVNEEMRQNIFEVAKKLNYPIKDSQSNSDENETKNVVVLGEQEVFTNTMYWVKIIDRLESELRFHGIHMTLSIVELNESSYAEPTGIKPDGYIILGLVHEKIITGIEKKKIPIVFLDYKKLEMHHDHIRVNNHLGMIYMTELIIKKNHRHLLFLGDTAYAASFKERYTGIRDCIESHNELNIVLDHIKVATGIDVIDARDEILTYMSQPECASVIIAANDALAMACCKILKNAGYRIPEDVSVVGFDNVKEYRNASPRLTSVEVPKTELAIWAVKTLLSKIQNPEKLNIMVMIEPNLIERDSLIERRE